MLVVYLCVMVIILWTTLVKADLLAVLDGG